MRHRRHPAKAAVGLSNLFCELIVNLHKIGHPGNARVPCTSARRGVSRYAKFRLSNYKSVGGNCEKTRAECQPLRLLSHRASGSTLLFSVRAEKEKKQTYQEARRDCDYDCIYRLFAEVNYHLGS